MCRDTNKQHGKVIFFLAFLTTFSPGFAASANISSKAECSQIKELARSGKLKKYSVPFEDEGPDAWFYKVDVDKDGRFEKLIALCGHGSDATCEMLLKENERNRYRFSTAASIRVIDYKTSIYVVTGVTYTSRGASQISDFFVFKLNKNSALSICAKQ